MFGSWLAPAVAALVVTLAGAGTATARPADLEREEDPCRTREPTELDRLPWWQCVGLADFVDDDREIDEEPMDIEQVRRLDRPGRREDDFGVAVSPDGRLYVQIRPAPGRHSREGPAANADGREEDPEGEPRPDASRRLQSILGCCDNRQIRTSTTAYPWRALVAILNPGATTSNCSGVLVGPRHVLTAGHCIYDKNANAWIPNRKVAPGMNGIGVFPNGLKNHNWYYSVKGWFQNEDPRYDYAMIILQDLASTASLGWFGWRTSGHSGGTWNFGYPGWWRTCAASPSPPQCNNFLYGDDGSIQTANWAQLGHSSDTQPGQSGSPVYKYNGGDRRVIAIHAYGAGNTGQNWGTRIRSAVSDNICKWIKTWPSSFQARNC